MEHMSLYILFTSVLIRDVLTFMQSYWFSPSPTHPPSQMLGSSPYINERITKIPSWYNFIYIWYKLFSLVHPSQAVISNAIMFNVFKVMQKQQLFSPLALIHTHEIYSDFATLITVVADRHEVVATLSWKTLHFYRQSPGDVFLSCWDSTHHCWWCFSNTQTF